MHISEWLIIMQLIACLAYYISGSKIVGFAAVALFFVYNIMIPQGMNIRIDLLVTVPSTAVDCCCGYIYVESFEEERSV